MSATSTINFPQIRQDHDLRTTVERYLGPPDKGKWLCPFHKEKTPSFALVGDEKDHFKCYGCGAWGDVVNFISRLDQMSIFEATQKLGDGYLLDTGLTKDEFQKRQQAIKEERLAEEEQKRTKALARVGQMTGKVSHYHSQVAGGLDYWHSQGLRDSTIRAYKLGYCPNFPIWAKDEAGQSHIAEYTPSVVIPYFHYGELVSIRHRLISRPKDKYRPEFAGLPNQLFNVDVLDNLDDFSLLESGEVALVEGEVKAMYLGQLPIPAVGMPGQEAWQEDWLKLFAGASMVYVILDPDAERRAGEITSTFTRNGISALQVTLPCKPDDFFVKNGGTIPEFMKMLGQGVRAR